MNHKNCRVKGCWSRGAPSFSTLQTRNGSNRGGITPPSPLYQLPKFRTIFNGQFNKNPKGCRRIF